MRTIRSDVVQHGCVCMRRCYTSQSVVSGQICGMEEDLEIHHVVDDHLPKIRTVSKAQMIIRNIPENPWGPLCPSYACIQPWR